MKILITGQNSYIGTSFETWAKQQNPDWIIDTIDVRGDEWKKNSFSEYDSVLHVAGIAHIKETKENEQLYLDINRDLPVEIAIKAKAEGVKQFVFLSSMSVYGIEKGIITNETICNPKTVYGKSKLEAEQLLFNLTSNDFTVSSIRPPMVYGYACKGNYQKISYFARKFPLFLRVNNERSMIYITNLSEFLRLIINDKAGGVFCPQNSEYVNTSELYSTIACIYNKKTFLLPGFERPVCFFLKGLGQKVFGTLIYDQQLSTYKKNYNIVNFKDTILSSECVNEREIK